MIYYLILLSDGIFSINLGTLHVAFLDGLGGKCDEKVDFGNISVNIIYIRKSPLHWSGLVSSPDYPTNLFEFHLLCLFLFLTFLSRSFHLFSRKLEANKVHIYCVWYFSLSCRLDFISLPSLLRVVRGGGGG